MTPEVHVATSTGSCETCKYPIQAGDHFTWGTERGARRHPWCAPLPPPPEPDEEEEAPDAEDLKQHVVDEILDRLPMVSPEDLAEMVALRLARPVDNFTFGQGPNLGTMNCSTCKLMWEVSDRAAFLCPNGCPPVADESREVHHGAPECSDVPGVAAASSEVPL